MAQTVHVYPSDGEWAVKKEGVIGETFATQQEALKVARETVRNATAGQVVVHGKNGQVRERVTYGMPTIQDPPKKSRLAKRIVRAVGKVALQRVQQDSNPPSDRAH